MVAIIDYRKFFYFLEGEKKTTSSPITTKPPVIKKNIDIQPSKIHKSTNEETKKSKNTKIIVNSVVQQKNEPKIVVRTKKPLSSD